MLGLQTAMGIATQTNNAAPEVQEKTLSIMDMIIDGGTGNIIIIGVLFLMLGVALYIYFERTFAIKAASQVDKTFMYKIRDCIAAGRLDAAKMLCVQSNTPVARLIEKGVSRIGKPLEDINKAREKYSYLSYYRRSRPYDRLLGYGSRYDYVISRNGYSWWAS